MTLYDQVCMEETAGFGLNCTANDVVIAGVAVDENGDYILEINDDGCAYPGDTVDFTATFNLVSNSKERHDIGIYFIEDNDPENDGALTGQCSISTIPYTPEPEWLDLDGTSDPFPGTNTPSDLQDLCGDISKDKNPMMPELRLTAVCRDSDGDGLLNLPYCLSWRQSGANDYCDSPTDAFPGAPSKCKCDDAFNVPIDVPDASLLVEKTVSDLENGTYGEELALTEPGGTAWFKIRVKNNGIDPNNWVDLDTLTDDVHGDLDGRGSCVVTPPERLDADGTDYYECKFQATISGNAGHSETDTVTASGLDQRSTRIRGTDTAKVTIGDAMPSISVTKSASPEQLTEPGGTVTFTVTVSNTSPASTDPVTIDILTDDIHGDLNGQGNCSVPQTIASGSTYSCSFSVNVTGNAGDSETDTVTASGADDEGNPVTASDDARVQILDATGDSGISVVKTANPTSVFEPGANVTFSVSVTNDSTVDDVWITSLVDDIHGDLDGQGGCAIPTGGIFLAKNGGSYSCSFTAYVSLDANQSEKDTVTATGVDDDGNAVDNFDSATVSGKNVAPSAAVKKTAERALVEFKVKVTNTSAAEDLTLDALVDDTFGNIASSSNIAIDSTTCEVPQTLGKATTADDSDTYSCTFRAWVTTSPHTNNVTATVSDNDGSTPAKPSDTATVTLEQQ